MDNTKNGLNAQQLEQVSGGVGDRIRGEIKYVASIPNSSNQGGPVVSSRDDENLHHLIGQTGENLHRMIARDDDNLHHLGDRAENSQRFKIV